MGDTSGVVTRVLGHTIVPDLAADRSSLCSMFDKMTNLATKPSSHDDGLVARLVILSRRRRVITTAKSIEAMLTAGHTRQAWGTIQRWYRQAKEHPQPLTKEGMDHT